MSEKRGLEQQSLINEYNTAGVLEIFLKDQWRRVITKDFRAFNGPRRITEPEYTEKYNPWTPMVTYEYYGPVYTWGTNNVVDYSDTGSLEKSEVWDKARKISESRGI
jgi:hypothetical protein